MMVASAVAPSLLQKGKATALSFPADCLAHPSALSLSAGELINLPALDAHTSTSTQIHRRL